MSPCAPRLPAAHKELTVQAAWQRRVRAPPRRPGTRGLCSCAASRFRASAPEPGLRAAPSPRLCPSPAGRPGAVVPPACSPAEAPRPALQQAGNPSRGGGQGTALSLQGRAQEARRGRPGPAGPRAPPCAFWPASRARPDAPGPGHGKYLLELPRARPGRQGRVSRAGTCPPPVQPSARGPGASPLQGRSGGETLGAGAGALEQARGFAHRRRGPRGPPGVPLTAPWKPGARGCGQGVIRRARAPCTQTPSAAPLHRRWSPAPSDRAPRSSDLRGPGPGRPTPGH